MLGELNLGLIVQGLMAVIMIGMFYILWATTKAYGGIIGKSLRLLGFGILFISVAVIERMLVNFNVLEPTVNLNLIQDVINLVGLSFLAVGFSKLLAVSRT